MTVDKLETLTETTVEILQDWTMLLVEPSDSLFQTSADHDVLRSTITFSSEGGEALLQLFYTAELANRVCANLLGMTSRRKVYESDGTSDAMLEVTNLIGNHLATKYFGYESEIEVGLPSIDLVTLPEDTELNDVAERFEKTFSADGLPILVRCELREKR